MAQLQASPYILTDDSAEAVRSHLVLSVIRFTACINVTGGYSDFRRSFM